MTLCIASEERRARVKGDRETTGYEAFELDALTRWHGALHLDF
jgi:hypothetical protein